MTRSEMIKYIIANDKLYTGVFHSKDSDKDLEDIVARIQKRKILLEAKNSSKQLL